MKELVGKTIKEMYVNEDQSLLKFVTDKGDVIYETEGDCCSETWFADIIFGYQWFNKPITSVTELEVPEWVNKMASKDGRTRQEYDEVYGYQVVADVPNRSMHGSNNASCDIIFRNSSNGYYCGSCGLMDQDSKWSKEKLEKAEWTQITEDWQA